MDLLRYEFIDAPDGSINGMLRTLVKGLRYNSSNVTVDEFKKSMPGFHAIESTLQQLDAEISNPKRNYIKEIMEELDQEQNNKANITKDLTQASIATIQAFLGRDFQFDELLFTIGKADHYYWLQFIGYSEERAVDANLIIVKEVFRSICNKYNYIFVDFS
ncbi:MAG: hypothetical protein ABI091_17145 [Ferruginibacter sp.]